MNDDISIDTGELTQLGFETSRETKNIIPAFVKAQAMFSTVQKSKQNQEQKYKYATLDDYFDILRPALGENGLAILCNVENVEYPQPRQMKSGSTWYVVRVRLRQRLYHESGEWIDFICYGEGLDSGDKAYYKAVTGARKYGLSLLGISTGDDPEKDSHNDDQTGDRSRPQTAAKPVSRVVTRRDQQGATPSAAPAALSREETIGRALKAYDYLFKHKDFISRANEAVKIATNGGKVVLKDGLESLDSASLNSVYADLKRLSLEAKKSERAEGGPDA